jgi:ParB family chromosome partitioning protein
VDAQGFRVLLRSVQAHGILVPLLVRPRGRFFELISGHRRLLAAHRLGLKEVPVIVRRVDARQIEELRLLENASHEVWHPLDVAAGIERFCLTSSPEERKRLLEILAMREGDLPDMLRLLKAPELLKDAVSLGLISEEEALRLAEEGDAETIHRVLGLTDDCEENRGIPEPAGTDLVPESAVESLERGC